MARTTRASASQPQPTQTQSQRFNRRRVIQDDSDDSDGYERDQQPTQTQGAGEEHDEDGDAIFDSMDRDTSRMIHSLVRLALFNEHKRTPLRREEITKKVLMGHSRMFNTVFHGAQELLRDTFGMELVELQSRAELDQLVNGGGKDAQKGGDKRSEEARGATGVKKRVAASGSKTYILRSTLDPKIIQYATLTDEQILEKEMAVEDEGDSDEEYDSGRSLGSIINWSKSDQLGSIGILYVILALILVNGRVINNMELRSHLRQLKLEPHTPVYFTRQSTHPNQTLDTYLTTLMRQGYIDKIAISADGNKKGGAVKRGRNAATQGDDDNAGAYEWRWGIRSQSEIGERKIAEFMAEFMVDKAPQEQGEDGEEQSEDEAEKEEHKKKVERMYKGIERSAGGALQDIK